MSESPTVQNRLDFLEVQIDALRALIMTQAFIAEQERPGTLQQIKDISDAVMTRTTIARHGPLYGALNALIEDIEQLRDLPAND